MITPQQIFDATNGGLDIIRYYYPNADEKKPFRMRDERTPSSRMKRYGDVWKCTDFGDDSHARDAINICMREEKLTFQQAIYTLAGRYGVTDNTVYEANRPDIRQRKAEGDEKPGDFTFETKNFTERELKVLGPRVTAETCKKYGYRSLVSYSTTDLDKKTGEIKTTTIRSTDTYPIFMRECENEKDKQMFYKIYQVFAYKKENRFRFYPIGKKQYQYINGLAELKVAVKEHEEKEDERAEEDRNRYNDDDDDGKGRKKYKREKFPAAVICSGERDALCCAALGYHPLWFNSESYRLSEDEYRQIEKLVETIYNIPDIDETGVREGVELGMTYLDIHTIWLPEWLKTYRDARGKHRKDLRDFVEIMPDTRSFKELLDIAMPMRFWEYAEKDDGRQRLEINSEYLRHHLRHCGFGIVKDENESTGKKYIFVEKNVVREIFPREIKAYMHRFMAERNLSIQLRNLVNNSRRLGESLFDQLNEMQFDFTDYEFDKQFMFFENATWEVTAGDVKEHRANIDRYVWKKEIIPHQVKRLAPSFAITHNADADAYDIEIKNKQSKFFSYLINSSRVYWREELEQRLEDETFEGDREAYIVDNKFSIDGSLLTEDEIDEQKQHLINKIFAIGYLLHRYKAMSRAWCVYAMDWKMSENISECNP